MWLVFLLNLEVNIEIFCLCWFCGQNNNIGSLCFYGSPDSWFVWSIKQVDMTALKQMGESDLKELGIPMVIFFSFLCLLYWVLVCSCMFNSVSCSFSSNILLDFKCSAWQILGCLTKFKNWMHKLLNHLYECSSLFICIGLLFCASIFMKYQ